MRIADRYIVREIFAPFLLGVAGFVVLLVGDVLYALAELVARKQISLGVLTQLLVYKLPAILVITFPVATLFGTLLGLARLVKDRELQAMRLAGVSLTRIFAPVAGSTGPAPAGGALVVRWTFSGSWTLWRRPRPSGWPT